VTETLPIVDEIRLVFFFVALRPNAGYGFLIHEVSWLHNDAPQSVELLWTNDQLVAETSTLQHTTLKKTDIHALGGIRTYILSRPAAAELRLRPCGHWGRHYYGLWGHLSVFMYIFIYIYTHTHTQFFLYLCTYSPYPFNFIGTKIIISEFVMQHISDKIISGLRREAFSIIIREYDDKTYTLWVLRGVPRNSGYRLSKHTNNWIHWPICWDMCKKVNKNAISEGKESL